MRKVKFNFKKTLIFVSIILTLIMIFGFVFQNNHLNKQSIVETFKQELLDNKGSYDEQKIVLQKTNEEDAKMLANLIGAKLRITKDGSFATLTLPDGVTIYDIVSNPKYSEVVEKFSIDYQATTSDIEEIEEKYIPKPSDVKPSDELYTYQTYLDYLNLGSVWNYTKGDGITVAVIDTGIDTDHPEFEGKISEYSYNATEDKIVKDYLDENGNYDWSLVEDEVGHGTAVTGVIAAPWDNGGIVGLAPNVEIITIKAECNQDGSFVRTSDLVFGLYYAIERDVDLVNMSFGGYGPNPYADAALLAVDSDIVLVAAAGNDSTAALSYPAADPNVIGVGALADGSFELARYSNFGENTDIVAPGTVYTTAVGGGYRYINGTSFASPVTVGVLALQLSYDRNYRGLWYQEYSNIQELLHASSNDLGDLGRDWYFGYGALDATDLILSERKEITFNYLTDEIDNTTQVFIKDKPLQDIPEPERNYAVFDGWYYDIYCTEEYNLYADSWSNDLTMYCNWANEDDSVPYTYVELDDGTIEIRSYTGKRRYITVPEYIDGKVVSSIGVEAFLNQSRLRLVNLPKQLKYIRSNSFANCTNLTSINIPDSVISIDSGAFQNNVRLYNVNFGGDSKLEAIGQLAFKNCSNLSRIDLPVGVKTITGNCFLGCTSLKQVNADRNSKVLTSTNGVLFNKARTNLIVYPAGKTDEFYTVPSTVTVLGESSFAFSRIKEVDLKNVEVIDSGAFQYSNIRKIDITDKVYALGEAVFYYSNITDITLGHGLTSIPKETFAYTSLLRKIEISNTIQVIGKFAFYNSSINTATFEKDSSLILFDSSSFKYSGLQKLDMPDSVIFVGAEAFAYASLSELNIYDTSNLTQIGDSAFLSTSISKVNLPDSLQYLGQFSFAGTFLSEVSVPKNVNEFGCGAFASCHYLQNIYVDDENAYYVDVDGVAYSKDLKTLHEYPAGRTDTVYDILSSVELVQTSSFYGSFNLHYVNFPEGLKTIGEYAFYECINIYQHNLPYSLETIQRYAFAYNNSLNGIDIPTNVIQISNYAFMGDYNMSYVNFAEDSKLARLSYGSFAYCGIYSFRIPANVSTIAQDVFIGCPSLYSITFAQNSKLESVSAYLFKGCNNLQYIYFEPGSQLTSIQAHAFEGMQNLYSIDFGDAKITNVDNYAFRYCESLQNITLPNTVEYIGRYAFYDCKSLSSINIPESVEFIGRYAFYLTNNLNVYFESSLLPLAVQENWDYGINGYYVGVFETYTEGDYELAKLNNGTAGIIRYNGSENIVDLTNLNVGTITQIGGYAFEGTSVEGIVLPSSLKAIDRHAFANSSIKEIAIPKNVEQIGDYAFYNSSLSKISFEEGSTLQKIGMYAFSSTKELGNITLPKTLKYLGSYAFLQSGLQTVNFEDGIELTEIKEGAFQATNLVTVKIPNSITLIDHNAFRDNASLEKVDFGTAKVQIMTNVFYNTGLKEVYIPETVEYIGEYSFVGLKKLTSFNVSENNEHYASKDGVLYSKDYKKLIAYPGNKTGSFKIPNTVEVIGFGAFENSKLTKVDFEQGINLLTFGYRAFYNSLSLKEINIPESVVSIDYYAFAMCQSLETVIFAPNSKLTGIYEGAFYGCTSLRNITIPDEIYEISDYAFSGCLSLDKLPITENSKLLGIYEHAFENTAITELKLPASLIDIGSYAFKGLKVEKLEISSANKEQLIIGLGAFAECNELEEIAVPFIGASLDDERFYWFGYIFGAGNSSANATYVPNSLKVVKIAEGQTNVFIYAFEQLNNIETVYLPNSVENIYNGAFAGCTNLKEIHFSSAVKSLYSFNASEKLESIYFNGSMSDWAEIEFGWDTPMRYAQHLYLLNDKGEWYEPTNVIIANGVTSIQNYAFYNIKTLTRIEIPASVTMFGTEAFGACEALEEVYYHGTLEDWLNIEFESWNSTPLAYTNNLYVLDENGNWYQPTSYVIKEGTKEISDYAFTNIGSLKTIEIPKSVTSIKTSAFEYCYNLEDVYYHGTYDEWLDITKESEWGSNPMIFAEHLHLLDENGEWYEPTELSVKEGTKIIKSYQYVNLSSLKTIHIPNSVKTMESEVFNGSMQLENVYFHGTLNEWFAITTNGWTSSPMVYAKHLFVYDENGQFYEPTSVVIEDGVTEIEEYQFRNFSSLVSIEIPTSVTKIKNDAFAYCDALENVYYHGTIEQWISVEKIHDPMYYAKHFYLLDEDNNWYEPTKLVYPSDMNQLNDYLVTYLPSINYLVIPGSYEKIPSWSFDWSQNLETIEIQSGIIEIEEYAFYACQNLKTVYLPKTLTKIGNYAFLESNNLEAVYYNGTIEDWMNIEFTTVYSNPAYYAKHLYVLDEDNNWYEPKELVIKNGVTSINKYSLLNLSSLTSIELPATITKIGELAFDGCQNLLNVYYRGTILQWHNIIKESNPMNYAAHLYFLNDENEWYEPTKMVLPEGLEVLDQNILNTFPNVTHLVIPGSYQKISNYSFYNAEKLEIIEIQSGITEIENDAFYACYNLQTIYLPNTITKISDNVFNSCYNLQTIYFDGTIEEWMNIEFNSDYSNPLVYGGKLYLLESGVYKELVDLEIPSSFSTIEANAFNNFNYVKKVIIPNTVTTINSYAFDNFYNLETVEIASSVTKINDNAFSNCNKLEYIYYNGTLEDWMNVEFSTQNSNPMYYAKHLYLLNENNEWYELVDVVIPNGINKINDYTFFNLSTIKTIKFNDNVTSIGCYSFCEAINLREIYLPQNISEIKEHAFANCSNLDAVYYYGSISELLNILYIYPNTFDTTLNHLYVLDDNNKWIEPSVIEFSDSFEYIDNNLLSYFRNVEAVILPSTIKNLTSEIKVNDTPIKTVYYKGSFDQWVNIDFIYQSNPMAYVDKFYMLDENNNWYEPTKMVLSDNVSVIKRNAYYYNSLITDIEFSSSIKEIHEYAFEGCENLENVYYRGTLEDWSHINFYYYYSNPMNYASNLYVSDENNNWILANELHISNGETEIGRHQFYNVSSLKNVYIPTSTTKISEYAFSNCTNLNSLYYYGTYDEWLNIEFETETSNPMYYASHFYMLDENNNWYEPSTIAIKDGTTDIKEFGYQNISSLITVYIPSSVERFNYNAFRKCENLQDIYYYGSVNDWFKIENIYEILNYTKNIYFLDENNEWYQPTEYVVEAGITEIVDSQFKGFGALESIYLPESITRIGNEAFAQCDNLKNVYYYGTMDSWVSIEFNSNKSTPMHSASHFYLLDNNNNWYEPTEAVISEGITEIGEYALHNINTINKLTLPSSLDYLSYGNFSDNSGLVEVYYNGTIEDWINVYLNSGCEGNPMYYAELFYTLDENGNWCLPTDLYIPEGVETIRCAQYSGNKSIVNVHIPNSVKSIEPQVFFCCDNLTNAYYYGTLEQWLEMNLGEWTSNPANNGANLYLLDDDGNWYFPTEIVIPDGTYKIKPNLFYGVRSLNKVTLPESLTEIGYQAFNLCYNLFEIINNSNLDIIPRIWNGNQGYISSYSLVVNNRGEISYADSNITSENYKYFETEDGFVFLQYGDTYYLISYKGDEEVPVIPYQINGHFYSCKYIDSSLKNIELSSEFSSVPSNMFERSLALESIILPDNITSIEYYAFRECINLTSINLPSSLTYIYGYAFEDCKKLSTIVIPESVTSIGEYAFNGCISLETVVNLSNLLLVKGSKDNGLVAYYAKELQNLGQKNIYVYDDFIVTILNGDYYLLSYAGDQERVVLPLYINGNRYYCTYMDIKLKDVELSTEFTTIPYEMFEYCISLESIVIPSTVKNIEYDAFTDCTNLKEIYYNGTINDWIDIEFNNDYSNPIMLADSFFVLDENNNWYEPTDVVIKEGETTINFGAFVYYKKLNSVELPSSIQTIETRAFYECTNLDSIYYRGSIDQWMNINFEEWTARPNYYARRFYILDETNNWEQITNIKIPEGTEVLEEYLFYNFASIKSIELPSTLKSFGFEVFYGCDGLTDVYYNGSVDDWMNIEFETWSSSPFNYAHNFHVLDQNNNWIEPTKLVIKDGTTKINYNQVNFYSLEEVTIPSSITSIEGGNFYYCENLVNVYYNGTINDWLNINMNDWSSNPMYRADNFYVQDENGEYYLLVDLILPEGSTKISYGRFAGNKSIKNVYIPKSIETIDCEAFYECYNLENVYYYGSLEDWLKIDFASWSSNPMQYAKNFYVLDENNNWIKPTSVIIPEGTKVIEQYKFNNITSLLSVEIPSSVVTIEDEVFSGCVNLENVYYHGTLDEWSQISFSNSNSDPMHYASHFYILSNDNEWVELTELKIKDDVTSIKDYEYESYELLQSVNIPEGVTRIGYYSFANCVNLTKVELPSSIKTIEYEAFYNCESLDSVYYHGTFEQWLNINFSSMWSNPMSSAEHFYMKDSNNEWYEVTNFVVPESVSILKNFNVYGFENLTTVTLHSKIEEIEYHAFEESYNITNLYYNGTIEDLFTIEYEILNRYPLSIISNIYLLDENNNWVKPTEVRIPSSCVSINNNVISLFKDLKTIIIPNTVKEINYNFNNNQYLVNVYYEGEIIEWLNIEFANDYSNPMSIAKYFYILSDSTWKELTEVVFEKEMSEIKAYALYGISSVEKIIIEEGVTTINEYAFANLTNLKQIYIPSSITSIGLNAFNECTSLKDVYYYGSLEQWFSLMLSSGYSNPMDYAKNFYILNENNEWVKPTTITLPNNIEYLHSSLLKGYDGVETLILNEGLTHIYSNAFDSVPNLKNLYLPASLSYVSSNTFGQCEILQNVYYYGTIESLLSINFENWEQDNPIKNSLSFYMKDSNNEWNSLTEAVIPSSMTSVDFNRLNSISSIKTLRLEEGTKVINDWALAYLSNIETIYLPSTLEKINYDPFFESNSLNTIYYNGSISDWVNIEFTDMTSNPMYRVDNFYFVNESNEWEKISTLHLDESITKISKYAFVRMNSLSTIYISNKLEKVDEDAFYECNNIDNIYYYGSTSDWFNIEFVNDNSNPCKYANNLFILDENDKWVKPTKLEFNSDIEVIGEYTFGAFKDVEEINIKGSVKIIESSTFQGFKTLKSIYLPSSLEQLYYDVFHECENLENVFYYGTYSDWGKINFLTNNSNPMYYAEHFYLLDESGNWYEPTKVVVEEGTTEILYGTFAFHTNLTELELPSTLKLIKNYAFYECTNLSTVYYHGTINDWMNVEIEDWTSSPMSYAKKIYFLDENNEWYEIENIILEDGISEIGTAKFKNFSSLRNIEIPQSVTEIGYEAFSECFKLENVYYHGTVEDWMKIEFIGWGSNPMIYAKHFYILDENNEWYEPQIINIKSGTTEIKDNMFRNFSSLISIEIPSSVTYFGSEAFTGCTQLQTVYYHGTIEEWMTINSYSNPMSYAKYLYVLDENGEFVEPTELVIPEGTTEIRDYLFQNFNSLQKVIFPSSLERIGYGNFGMNSKLEEVYFNGTLDEWLEVEISSWDYNPISSAKRFYVLDENDNYYIPSDIVIKEGTTEIGYAKFVNYKNLTSIELPSSLRLIRSEAFYECINLQSVYYHGTIEDWMNIEFESWCSNPTQYARNFYLLDENGMWTEPVELVIPEGVTEIPHYAFKGIKSLRKVTLPSSLAAIGYDAFYDCINLIEIVNNSDLDIVPGEWNWDQGYISSYSLIVDNRGEISYRDSNITSDNCKYIETSDGFVFLQYGDTYYLISYKGDEDVPVLPYMVNNHTYYGRYMDNTLKNIELSNEFIEIPSSMFESARSLETVILPNTVKYIYWGAFSNCTNLKSINLPNSIISIDGYVFNNCRSLTSIILPNSINYISYGMFSDCINLVDVSIPASVIEISSYAFYNCSSLTDISLSPSVISVGEYAFEYSGYWNDENNWVDGNLYLDHILLKVNPLITEYYLPDGITCIASYAFDNCYSLITVEVTGESRLIFNNCSNIELLIVDKMPSNSLLYYFGYGIDSLPITLSKVVIKNECVIMNGYEFQGMYNIKIFVDEYELNVQWDHDFPYWNNNNEVFYKGEWINVKFFDHDDSLLYEDYLSTYEMIRQPIIKNYVQEGTVYNFVGWDINGDGVVDDYPAMSNIDLVAKAVYTDAPYVYTVTYYDIDRFTVLHQETYSYGDTLRLINAPSKLGYTFNSWTNYPANLVVEKDLSIYSDWTHIGGAHAYEKIVVDPTCQSEGYTLYKCSVCMHEYIDNYVQTLDHSYGEWIIDKESTCLEEGSQHHICEICNHVEHEKLQTSPHDYETTIISKATCTNNGEIKHTCKVCHDEFNEYTNTINHKYHKKLVNRSLFEIIFRYILNMFYGIENNNYYYYQCDLCGHILLNSENDEMSKVMGACEHNDIDWVTVAEATCTHDGYLVYKCFECDEILEAKTTSLEGIHNYEEKVVKPTCNEQGYTLITCSCGKSYKDNFVEATGHEYESNENGTHNIICSDHTDHNTSEECTYGEWIVVTPPSEYVDGLEKHKCEKCGYEETRTISSTHEHVYNVDTYYATCDSDGYNYYYCIFCSYSFTEVFENAYGHNYTGAMSNYDGTHTRYCANNCGSSEVVSCTFNSEVIAPGCDTQGYTHYYCECGYSYYDDYVEPVGHNFTGAISNYNGTHIRYCANNCGINEVVSCTFNSEVIAPGCDTPGYTHYYCECGYSYDADYVDAYGHNYTGAVSNNDGTHIRYCTNNCGSSEVVSCNYDFEVFAPGCETQGFTYYHCECGYSYYGDYVDPLGHNYIGAYDNHDGTHTRYCENNCGTSEIVSCTYSETVYEPTCITQGYSVFTCECGYSYIGSYVEALGHDYTGVVCNNDGTHTVICGRDNTHNSTQNCTYGAWEVVIPAGPFEEGLEKRVCSECAYEVTRVLPATHEHEYSDEWTIEIEPTCTTDGLKSHHCIRDDCYDSIDPTIIEALGHKYTDEVVEPTCTKQGYTTHSCERCNDSYVDSYTNALGHSYGEWVVVKEATEEETGLQQKECGNCGEVVEQVIPVLSHVHKYTSTVVDATCTERGYTEHTCSCGNSYKDSYTNALGHSYGEWVVVKEATEEETGLREKECEHCGDVVEETIPVLSHVHKYTSTVVDATCTERGYTEHVCSCGNSYKDSYTNPLGHSYGEWVVVKEATEEETGLREKECEHCGDVVEETIPVLSHVHKYTSTVVDATCTERGYTEHVCSCGNSYKDSYTNPLGHSYGEWIETIAPTCTTKGIEEKTCTNCGYSYKRSVNELGHNYIQTVTEPTCERRGYTTHKCDNCDDLYVDTYVAATGHEYGEWIIDIESTCTKEGSKHHVCKVCESSETASVPKKDHIESDWIIDDEPTTEERGLRHTECKVCGEIIKDEFIDKLEHEPNKGCNSGCNKNSACQLISITNALSLAILIFRKRR